MIGTRHKVYQGLPCRKHNRWSVILRRQGEVLIMDRKYPDMDQFCEHNYWINKWQAAVNPKRP